MVEEYMNALSTVYPSEEGRIQIVHGAETNCPPATRSPQEPGDVVG